jgi:streptogramin lyase
MNVYRDAKSGRPADGEAEVSWALRCAPARLIARLILCALIASGAVGTEAASIKPKSPRFPGPDPAGGLNPGDIIFTDSEAAVLRLDPATKQTSVLATGGRLVRPCGIALGPENTIYVADTGCAAVIAVNAETGDSTVLSQGDKLGVPFGIAVSAEGEIFVANGQAVLGINPADGTQRTASSGGVLKIPLGVAVAPNGDLYVADAGGFVARIDGRNGRQSIVATGQNLVTPIGIVVQNHKAIYISDSAARRIIEVDPRTGGQRVVSAEGALASPFGLALGGQDNLLVGDPDAIDLTSGIISVNLRDGAQYPLVTGSGNFVNYRCVAVVPGHPGQP